MAERIEVRFEGLGGQGIVLASVVLAEALGVYQGLEAVQTSTYDPETRGASVRADVVSASEPVNYPGALRPDVIVAMSQKAADKSASLARGGVLIVDPLFVERVPAVDGRVYRVPVTEVADRVGRRQTANMVMLGALARFVPLVSMASLEQAVAARAPRGTAELNLAALHAGYAAAASVAA